MKRFITIIACIHYVLMHSVYSQSNSVSFENSFQIGISNISFNRVYYLIIEDDSLNIYSIPDAVISYSLHYNKKMNSYIDYSFRYAIHPLHNFSVGNYINILPIFFSKPSRINLYVPILFDFNLDLMQKNKFKIHAYTFGLGTSLRIKNHIGVHLEYKYTKSNILVYKPYLQFGISYNWGKIKDE